MKVGKCQKFGDLIMKTVALVKFLKTETLTEDVSEFSVGRGLNPMQTLVHFLLEFKGIFCF